jgi:hypothetical protein
MKKTFYAIASAIGIIATSLVSCEKPNYVEPNTEAFISDFYGSMDGYGTNRLFNSRFSNDTIYVDVSYHYPIDSDFEVDLSKLLLKASIPRDSYITPSLDGFTDLTTPKIIKVVAGDGAEKQYVIVANKKGDASVASAKIAYKSTSGDEVIVDGIINNGKITFYVMPGENLSAAKLTYVINKHAQGSIANGATVNLTSGSTPFTVTAPGNNVIKYNIEVKEPVKLAQGVGISRRLFKKIGADFSFSTNNNTGFAVSGDYLVLAERTNPSNLRVYNRFTGAYVKNMVNPITGAMIFQIAADSEGHIITTTYTAVNGTFQVYKYQDINDTAPVKLFAYVNNNVGSLTGDRALGRKVRIFGNLNGDAVIVSAIAATNSFYRWTLSNGAVVSATPEFVQMNGVPATIGLQNSIQPLGTSASANYFASFQGGLRYMNGTNNVVNIVDVEGADYVGSINYFEFNNAKFLATTQLRSPFDAGKLVVYDITNPANFVLTPLNSNFKDFRIYSSELFTGSTNGNATSDVCFGKSADGETMQVYMLLTNGGILAQEFTKYSDK